MDRQSTIVKVYDVLGQAVREIATGHYPAGTHKATLDASGLATGVYLHKPQANSFIDVNILVIYQ